MSTPDVCDLCKGPISMGPDAVSRRRGKRPENYRCPKCAQREVRSVMGATGGRRKANVQRWLDESMGAK